MKVALLLGFYNPVEVAVRAEFGEQCEAGNVVWIGQSSFNRPPDLARFKSDFFQVIDDGTMDPIIVVLASVRSYEWIELKVKGILDAASNRAPGRQIDLVVLHNPQDSAAVLKRIGDFGLPVTEGEITETMIHLFLGGSKALCVRPSWQTGFEQAFSRIGVKPEWYPKYFIEKSFPRAENSNLVQWLKEKATGFDYLLYAWKGLRTLPSEVKQKYKGKAIEGETTALVVSKFRKFLLSS